MKKRVLVLLAVLGFLLSASTGDPHQNLWCHYPPGQWTGVPGLASHVLILLIDTAADSQALAKHLGHSPSLTGSVCDPTTFNGLTATGCAEGVPSDPANPETSCPGSGCPKDIDGFQEVQVPPGSGPCLCNPATVKGMLTFPSNIAPASGNCGGAG